MATVTKQKALSADELIDQEFSMFLKRKKYYSAMSEDPMSPEEEAYVNNEMESDFKKLSDLFKDYDKTHGSSTALRAVFWRAMRLSSHYLVRENVICAIALMSEGIDQRFLEAGFNIVLDTEESDDEDYWIAPFNALLVALVRAENELDLDQLPDAPVDIVEEMIRDRVFETFDNGALS